jgi:hypothetical protein
MSDAFLFFFLLRFRFFLLPAVISCVPFTNGFLLTIASLAISVQVSSRLLIFVVVLVIILALKCAFDEATSCGRLWRVRRSNCSFFGVTCIPN